MAFKTLNNTFTDLAVSLRLENVNSFLKEIDSLIDFNQLRPILKKNGIGTKNVCGVKAYDSVLMFKILLIQKFYDLSDEKVEEGLNVNLLYLRFVGLSLEDPVPDSTTIGRFRNALIKHKIYDELFASINQQLENNGFIASGGKDVLIDATLTKSDNNTIKSKNKEQKSEHRKKVEADNKAIDVLIDEELNKEKPSAKKISKLLKKKSYNSKTLKNEELDEIQNRDTKAFETSKDIIEKEEDSYDHKNKIDKDIRTGYQAGKKQYATGYKNHIATDAESGAILEQLTTFANTSDISTVDMFVEKLGTNMKSLGADKAYKSQEVDRLLEKHNIKNDVCLKETKKMTDEKRKELRENEKPKHQIRAKVEHTFALIKTQMKQSNTRFIGLLRNHLNFTITCIAANLKLFAHKQIRLQKVRNR
ncbi:MAG: IS5 family transposase [Epsilonproteobacteria bacterium]|nr:MAG: IS5 family transposase [Campylobacterota bacterium]